ncbi:MAG: 4'-phosphopantetheinyl transferase superfamily protein [Saprospiraceae bacterium]
MPVVFQKEDPDLIVLVWKIEEPISFFLSQLPDEEKNLPSVSEVRNAPWLAARYLLHLLIDQPEIIKDFNRKPFLANDDRYISISHSFDVAAVMLAHRPCGIDIEKALPRLQRIETKFINPEDLLRLKSSPFYTDDLYKIWCAKEAMYKAYGLGQIDFKKNLLPDINSIIRQNSSFKGELFKDEIHLSFNLNYEKVLQQYHLVYGCIQ